MVPETGVEADHNWPQRMTMTTTNVEILRQGWLDAASALAPGLETLPEFLENGLDAAVVDERLDEQSLLRVVTDVTSAAADSLPAEELYFLTRRLQRAVYEYLLSLDALPEPPQRRDGSNGHGAADTTLIGAEEVAALGRNGVVKVKGDPAHALETIARPVQEPELAEPEHAEPVQPEPEHASVSDTVEAGLAQLDAQLSPEDDEPVAVDEPEAVAAADVATEPEVAAEPEAAADPAPEPSTRPAFTLFRRTGAKTPQPAVESNGHAQTEAEATPHAETESTSNGSAPAAETAPNGGTAAGANPDAEGEEPFVAPRDGFHLNDLADFAVVQRTAAAAATPEAAAPVEVEPVEEFGARSSRRRRRRAVSRRRGRGCPARGRRCNERRAERRRRARLEASRRRSGPDPGRQRRPFGGGRSLRDRPRSRRSPNSRSTTGSVAGAATKLPRCCSASPTTSAAARSRSWRSTPATAAVRSAKVTRR